LLFFTVVVFVCFGLVIAYSASSMVATLKYGKPSHYFLLRQSGWALVSFFALMYFKRMDYGKLRSPVWAFGSVGVMLILLAIVYFVDPRNHRWIRLGPLSVQPLEFAKPALVIFLAWFVSRRLPAINNLHTLIPAAMALSVMAFAIVFADFGTTVVLVVTAGTVFFVAGLGWRAILFSTAAGMAFLLAAVLAKPYRVNRVINFLDPDYTYLGLIDPHQKLRKYGETSVTTRDSTYQARQSKIAVGSGGVFGLGLMQGKQKLLYLPEAHTDFVYAVIGEELGLWGCFAVLFGFLIIARQGLRLFWTAPDDFGRYLALGVTVCVVVQAFMNMSVVLDLGPTKGIPLPMISHGGSSLLATLIMLGMLLSVSEHAE
jgi:cell division protein FtsW